MSVTFDLPSSEGAEYASPGMGTGDAEGGEGQGPVETAEVAKPPALVIRNKKFRWAVRMIMIRNAVAVQLRPTEVQYYNSAFEIFDLDFTKTHQKVEKSAPSWQSSKFTKFDPGPDRAMGTKVKSSDANEGSSESSSSDESDEDLSSLGAFGGFKFGTKAPLAPKRDLTIPEDPEPESPRAPEKLHPGADVTLTAAKGLGQTATRAEADAAQHDPATQNAAANPSTATTHIAADKLPSPEPNGARNDNAPEEMGEISGEGKAQKLCTVCNGSSLGCEACDPTNVLGRAVESQQDDLVRQITMSLAAGTPVEAKGDRLCWNCRLPVLNSSTACEQCGADLLKKLCPSCQKPIKMDWKRCKHCGHTLPEVRRKRRRFVLNPAKYMPKRLSILSFWEFKNEVRKMKQDWAREALRWTQRNESSDAAFVISSVRPAYTDDRGAKPSAFVFRNFEEVQDGLWDPRDIYLAPVDGYGKPLVDYRSSRFDIAAKYRKVVKTVTPLNQSVSSDTENTHPDNEDGQIHEGVDAFGSTVSSADRRQDGTGRILFGSSSDLNFDRAVQEFFTKAGARGGDRDSNTNEVYDDHSFEDINRWDSARARFALRGRGLPLAEFLSSMPMPSWRSAKSGDAERRSQQASRQAPEKLHHFSPLLSRARQYNEVNARRMTRGPLIRDGPALQRPATTVPKERPTTERPITDRGPRQPKEVSMMGARGSWPRTPSHSPGICRPMTEESGLRIKREELNRFPQFVPQAPNVVIRHRDAEASSIEPSEGDITKHMSASEAQQIRPKTSASSQLLEPSFQDCIRTSSTASINIFFPPASSSLNTHRPQTISHSVPRPPMSSPSGARISSSHHPGYCRRAPGFPSPSFRPPNSARDSSTESQRGRSMWSVGASEPMRMGVKQHHRDPIRVGLVTPRRLGTHVHGERGRGQERKHSSLRDETFCHAQKVLQVVDGEIVLPSGQLRDGPRSNHPESHDSVMEPETLDLFYHFSDDDRLLRAGYLACLEFLGFLQPRARGSLRTNCRFTMAEALQLYSSIMDCTAESEEDEDCSHEPAEPGAPTERGLTEEQFEALLQALEVRMSRRSAHFMPSSAAMPGSESVERLLCKSASSSLSPRRSRSPRHPRTAPSSTAWKGVPWQDVMNQKDLPASEER